MGYVYVSCLWNQWLNSIKSMLGTVPQLEKCLPHTQVAKCSIFNHINKVMVNSNPNNWEAEARGLAIQYYPCLHSKSIASLGHRDLVSKKKTVVG